MGPTPSQGIAYIHFSPFLIAQNMEWSRKGPNEIQGAQLYFPASILPLIFQPPVLFLCKSLQKGKPPNCATALPLSLHPFIWVRPQRISILMEGFGGRCTLVWEVGELD